VETGVAILETRMNADVRKNEQVNELDHVLKFATLQKQRIS